MSLLKKILGIISGALLLIFVAGFVLPSHAYVERDILIDAEPSEIYALVSDFNSWEGWSPWAKMDPNAEMTITGSGLGQQMVWASEDPQVGTGSQEIIQLDEPSMVKTHLEFGGQGIADAAFTIISTNDGTQVTWSLDTDMREDVPFLMQPINTYVGYLLDSMVGKDYETGLQNLKQLAES